MRQITEAIVHCSATRADWMGNNSSQAKVDEIRRWHVVDRGWSDIGYHYIIDRDGTILEGRGLGRTGAHVKGHNKGTIGICLIGGFGSSKNDAFSDHYTPQQERQLRQLLSRLMNQYGFTKVSGHNDYAAKACPGFNVFRWLVEDTPVRTSPTQSKTVRAGTITAAVGAAGGAFGALGNLDPTAQYILLGGGVLVALLAMYIVKDRLRRWAEGVR